VIAEDRRHGLDQQVRPVSVAVVADVEDGRIGRADLEAPLDLAGIELAVELRDREWLARADQPGGAFGHPELGHLRGGRLPREDHLRLAQRALLQLVDAFADLPGHVAALALQRAEREKSVVVLEAA